MYESFFGLSRRAFAAHANNSQFFPAECAETARQQLERCVERNEGIALLVGPPGTGKSLLCRVVEAHFRHQMQTVLLEGGPLRTQKALLQGVLYGLGRPYRGLDEGEARLALLDHLSQSDDRHTSLLLLVDDAHLLRPRLLSELRMISNITHSNLTHEGCHRASLILAGTGSLEERLTLPKLDSLDQRIKLRCYLAPLAMQETAEYVRFQLAQAGGDAEQIFTAEALEQLHRATDGVPRLIDQLADHALLLAFADERSQIDADGIAMAWSDLQQLPAPWNTGRAQKLAAESANEATEATIEFGGSELDDLEFGALDEELPAMEAAPQRESVSLSFDGDVSFDEDASIDEEVFFDEDAIFDEGAPSDPARQLERISDSIESLEEEFQPLGRRQPEVELVFDDALPLVSAARPGHGHGQGKVGALASELSAGDEHEDEVIFDPYAKLDSRYRRTASALKTYQPSTARSAKSHAPSPVAKPEPTETKTAYEQHSAIKSPAIERPEQTAATPGRPSCSHSGQPPAPHAPPARDFRRLFATLRNRS